MKTTLLIMAAGIGSRYRGGIKQLQTVGPNAETIMDYSIHDAIEAGFDKLVFVLRREIMPYFMETVGDRLEKVCARIGVEVKYAFQELSDVPAGFDLPAERAKPWGTGQAVLACRREINEPFVVINADDYYGKVAFRSLYEYLRGLKENAAGDYCMAGYRLSNTLSDNGGVTRGICRVDANDHLSEVVETHNIMRTDGIIKSEGNVIPEDAYASMNMWGFTPEFMNILLTGFKDFLSSPRERLLKDEYLLPTIVDGVIKSGRASVKLLATPDRWFGVTYQEDKPYVTGEIAKLIAQGVYREELYSDL